MRVVVVIVVVEEEEEGCIVQLKALCLYEKGCENDMVKIIVILRMVFGVFRYV